LLDELDFVSIREQSTSLLTNDFVTSYKGEYSERLWIHTFQMMNFLLLNDGEGAAVEARQALQIYDEHGANLKNDWYSRALIAMSFEAAGKPDSAHIEYKKLIDDLGRDEGIARRAWQNAVKLGREEDAKHFKQLIGSETESTKGKGELVVFLQTGSIPPKIAGEIFVDPTIYVSFPIYPEIFRPDLSVAVQKDGQNQSSDVVNVRLVDISRSALAARGKRIAAKQVLRLVAKKNVADSVSDESEVLGGLLKIAFLASERADTRSWETLPGHVSLVQVPLSAGNHNISLAVTDGSRNYDVLLSNIDIESGKKTYRSIRIGAGAPVTQFTIPEELNTATPLPAP